MDEQWINNLRKRFAGRDVPAPEGLWESIRSRIGEDGKPAGKAPLRPAMTISRHSRTMRAVLIAACIIVILGIVPFLSFFQRHENETVSRAGKSTPTTSSNESPDLSSSLTKAAHLIAQETEERIMRTGNTASDEAGKLAGLSDTDVFTDDELSADHTETSGNGTEHSSQPAPGPDNRPPHDSDRQNNDYLAVNNMQPSPSGKKSSSTVSFSLYGANFSSIAGSSGSTMLTSGYADYQSSPVIDRDLMMMSVLSDEGMDVKTNPSVKAKHRKPVNIGISFRVPLSQILSIESGMFYSYHSSDFIYDNGFDSYTAEQRLHYVGVPVSANIGIWKNRHFEIYAKGGGAVEFCVSGKSKTNYLVDNDLNDSHESGLRDKRPQWSVNASAGAQYNFNNVIGVYAEPGVSYYFDNGSGVNTIYKEHKTDFTLNLGVRFTVK